MVGIATILTALFPHLPPEQTILKKKIAMILQMTNFLREGIGGGGMVVKHQTGLSIVHEFANYLSCLGIMIVI